MSKKPNIILILEDHKAYHAHGQLGIGPKIHRPNLEKLAEEGVEFTHAHTACPLCGPARRTMLTGLYPHNHHEIKNETNSPYKDEMYFQKLSELGYKNYYYGKWHAGKGTPLDLGFEGFSVPGYGNPYITPEYEEYIKKNNLPFMEVEIKHDFKDTISTYLGVKVGDKYQPKFPAYSEFLAGVMTTTKESHEAFFLASMACDKLKEIASDENTQPFHLRVDFWGPHEPYFPAKEFLDLYEPEMIPKHPSFDEDLNNKPEIYRKDISKLLAENNELIQPNPVPWSDWQEVLALNYAEQTLIDEAAGKILKTLEETGLAENTIVIWTADHGDGLASHGGHFDKDSYMPQELLRIPLVIRHPEVKTTGKKRDELVSNVDFAPTVLDIAGTSFNAKIDGESLLPLIKGENVEWREDLFLETHGHFTNIVGRVIMNGRYKYIHNEGDMDELYDLKEDPYEVNNLIDEKDHLEILSDLKNRLKEWRKTLGDNISNKMIKGKRLKRKYL